MTMIDLDTLTEEQVMAMEAGPEIDRLVALGPMGWTLDRVAAHSPEHYAWFDFRLDHESGEYQHDDDEWRPSTDLNHAFDVQGHLDPFGNQVAAILWVVVFNRPVKSHPGAPAGGEAMWSFMNASAIDRCRACLIWWLRRKRK